MTQTAIARACRDGGLISSSVACDRGTSAAPQIPCSNRASTICESDCANPQSMDAMVNPATEKRNTRLRPILPASQPLKGVMIATAMMYDVSTHDIWSCVADTEP
jgi:hypothetical protein